MQREQIITRLNEITSYFSFGRLLGYISFFNTIGIDAQLKHSQKSNRERLISSEIDFLTGLWLQNVDLKKSWDVCDDDNILNEVYCLMDDLHTTYTDMNNVSEMYVENFFYEGDLAYDWQYAKFAKEKYNKEPIVSILKEKHGFDVNFIASTLSKIKHIIEEQIKRRRAEKQRTKQYMSPMNAFTIKPNAIKRHFSPQERNILRRLSIKLGDAFPSQLKSITDSNYIKQCPIIELPGERGLFIINENAIAVAMNESPYYWLAEDMSFKKTLGSLRGDIAEKIVYNIVKRRFLDTSYHHIIIKKSKSANAITDIDVMLYHKEFGIVFQVKSKRLTELSKKGDLLSIEEDCNKAILEAFAQGTKCIDCLSQASNYYSLKKNSLSFCENIKFINVCITLDTFPGISSLSYLKNPINGKIPLIAMSIYDLDTIFYLFQADTIIEYFKFRAAYISNGIYGLNEIHYIGAFLANIRGEGVKLHDIKICREYAIYADYLIKKAQHGIYSNKDVDCDIISLMWKYRPDEPITCE